MYYCPNSPETIAHIRAKHKIHFEGKALSVDEFEKESGVFYLPFSRYRSIKSYHRIVRQCKRLVNLDAVERESLWLGTYHAKELNSAWVQPMHIRWVSEELGYGAFASRPIRSGAFIGEYVGLVKWYAPFDLNSNAYCFRCPSAPYYWIRYTIDAQNYGNEIRYIKHSNTPNCESRGVCLNDFFHVCLFAMRDIPAGEQLCYDYGKFSEGTRKKLVPIP
ncbi:MAG: hypothetical protein CMO81_07320 [Waddliaceae bacterium]|nr:hypothetical protein [Waddliaceae bacterium]